MTIVGYLASNVTNNTAEPIGVSPQNPLPVTIISGGGNGGETNYALETGGNLAAILANTPALGQSVEANSTPVVIASNQSAVPTETTDNSGNVGNILAPNITPSGYNAQFVALMPNIPTIVQKTNNISSGSVSSLAKAFANNNLAGNSIVVTCAVGNGTNPTVTDSQGNTYQLMANKTNLSALNVAMFLATNIKAGANTVTVNNGGTSTSMAMQIYELSGLFNYTTSQPAQSANNSGTSASASISNFGNCVQANEIIFMCAGNEGAAVTMTPTASWSNDSNGALNPTTPSNLYGFASASYVVPAALNPGTIGFTLGSSVAMAVIAVGLYPITIPTTNTNTSGTVTSGNATGSTMPSSAYPMGFQNSSSNLVAAESPGKAGAHGGGGDLGPIFYSYNYNGGSYDINQNNVNITTGDTPTIVTATTTNGATQTNYNARGAIITAILGTVSGTTPALQMQLQWSPDGGTTWLNYGPATTSLTVATGNTISIAVYPTALTATLLGTTTTADNAQINAPLPRTWRINYITTGTSISIAVASVQVNYIN